MKELLETQKKLATRIKNGYTNLMKKGRDNVNLGAIEAKIDGLNEYLSKFRENDDKIKKLDKKAFQEDTYFTEDLPEQVEEIFCEVKGQILQERNNLGISGSSTSVIQSENSIRVHELPRMEIPSFSGEFSDWLEFKDLFSEIVIKEKISEAEKLKHLKMHVKGEAADLLRSVQASEGNFAEAWKQLCDYYTDKRRLVTMYVEAILDQPVIKSNSLSDLKKLINGVNFSINSLKQLGRNPQNWDDLLVIIIIRKFDLETRKEWEKRSCKTTEIPAMKDLLEFINVRINILERVEISTNKKDSKQDNSRSSRFSSAHVSYKASCPSCSSDSHSIYACPDFKLKSTEEIFDLVKEKRLCFNCLGAHRCAQCTSKKKCQICDRNHHSLLHRDKESVLSSNLVISNSLNSTQPATVFSKSSSHSVHVSNASTGSKTQVLIPTALVNVMGSDGKTHKARAMIDSGSQSSFVSQVLLKKLNLACIPNKTKIYGVCNSQSIDVRGESTLNISSTHDSNLKLQVNALVLPFITKYSPLHYTLPSSWDHIDGLKLADTFENPPSEIDILLGGDVLREIAVNGLKTGPSGTPVAQNTIFGWTLGGAISLS